MPLISDPPPIEKKTPNIKKYDFTPTTKKEREKNKLHSPLSGRLKP